MRLQAAFVLVSALAICCPVTRADEATEPPVPVRTVSPAYPEELRRAGIPGVVTVSCTIDEKGNVTDAKVIKTSNAAFSGPALDALARWKFKPARRAGNAVPIKVSFPIKFQLEDS